MSGRKKEKRSRTRMLRTIRFLAMTALFCSFIAAGINYEASSPVSADNAELRVLSKNNDRLVLLMEDSGQLIAYYKDLSVMDNQLTEVGVLENGRAFFLDGSTLGIAQYNEDSCVFMAMLYDLDAELEQKAWCAYEYFPGEYDKLIFANVDIDTYTLYILSPDGELWSCETLSDPQETGYVDVEFLDATQGGWIYAYTDGMLLRWKGDGVDSGEIYIEAPCPASLVGEDMYISESGTLIGIKDGGLKQIDINVENINSQTCFAAGNHVIAVDSSGVIHKFDWSGEEVVETETTQADGEVRGIIDDYVLTTKDGYIYLTQLIFQSGEQTDPTPEPDSSEEATPSPGPEPDVGESEPDSSIVPNPDNEYDQPEESPTPPPIADNDEVGQLINELKFKELRGENGEYVALLAGARVSDLRKIYAPQIIEAFSQDGDPIYEAMLKTGTKIHVPSSSGGAEEISVIIRGDCDCDGKVMKSDIVFASLYIIDEKYAETEAQFMSMDMNDDGKVTIWDLPLIADEIERMKKF